MSEFYLETISASDKKYLCLPYGWVKSVPVK